AHNVLTINDPTLIWNYATMHGEMNRYKTVGSQECGFVSCKDSFSAQTVDHTYGDLGGGVGLYSNIRPYCISGEFTHCFEAATSHPGCYQELWDDNRFIDCFSGGILARGLEPTISNNEIVGTADPTGDEPAE